MALARLALRLECVPRLVEARLRRYDRKTTLDVGDLSQEVFSRVWARIDRYRGEGSLEGWIWSFVVYVIYAAVKQASRPSARTEDYDLDRIESVPPPEPSDSVECVLRALGRLSSRDEEVVTLRAIENRNYPEIAARLSCTVRAAKGRYQRAMTRLREALRLQELDGR